MKVSKLRKESPAPVNRQVKKTSPTPKTAVDPADLITSPNPNVEATREEAAGGDYTRKVPVGLDPALVNPEFNTAADQLIERLNYHYTVVKSEVYDRNKVVEAACNIIKARA